MRHDLALSLSLEDARAMARAIEENDYLIGAAEQVFGFLSVQIEGAGEMSGPQRAEIAAIAALSCRALKSLGQEGAELSAFVRLNSQICAGMEDLTHDNQ